MFDVYMEDTEHARIPVRMVGLAFILMRQEHDIWPGTGVDCILLSSHVICCEVYPHCLVPVDPIIQYFHCVALIFSVRSLSAIRYMAEKT